MLWVSHCINCSGNNGILVRMHGHEFGKASGMGSLLLCVGLNYFLGGTSRNYRYNLCDLFWVFVSLTAHSCFTYSMSAIDFYYLVDKVKGVDGKDRVALVFDGKYLPHSKQDDGVDFNCA
ncbi:uncharacterized protein LOC110767311 isoform X2 [Prunus avium]|uniref:Uncharacterized protein LOC110767311 isoform X2 n=1 Tax=Prunus avium TaxID=42229 RepID=A0A6P5THL2_PRUAV|nr:uncharacterized protein LOC110767311 isoform X2 [Prunus avium]